MSPTGLAGAVRCWASPPPLPLIAAAQGIAASAINPLIDSLALALAREGRIEYGPVRAVGSATFMVATAAAGWLLNRAGSWLVPWLLTTGYAAAALLTPCLPEAATPPAAPSTFAALKLFRSKAF